MSHFLPQYKLRVSGFLHLSSIINDMFFNLIIEWNLHLLFLHSKVFTHLISSLMISVQFLY